jgi:PPOX class probable FMN-dependent enzyme
MQQITSEAELSALLGEPTPQVRDKVRPELHDLDVAWLSAAPLCLVATAAADGSCDVSPKGDPAGSLVRVLDRRTIAIAERPGNRRADGYRNILQNPHVGLIFLIPGRGDTLRVNGRARLVTDPSLLATMPVKGHLPVLALVVDVDEVFHHCAKSLLRAQVWKPETWDPEGVVPARMHLAKALDRPDASLAELAAYYGPGYGGDLYGGPAEPDPTEPVGQSGA